MLHCVALLSSGYTITMRPATGVVSAQRACMPVMQDDLWVEGNTWNDPREGKPFGDADGPNRPLGKVRNGVEVYQPRGITDASVIKPQYIETDDEPWHSSSRQTVVATKQMITEAQLPFVVAEDALMVALSGVDSDKAAQAAMDAAVKDGARPGCPALVTGEKVIAAYKKDAEAGKKARPKAPKDVQGKGWDDMKREIGKTHDNSV